MIYTIDFWFNPIQQAITIILKIISPVVTVLIRSQVIVNLNNWMYSVVIGTKLLIFSERKRKTLVYNHILISFSPLPDLFFVIFRCQFSYLLHYLH